MPAPRRFLVNCSTLPIYRWAQTPSPRVAATHAQYQVRLVGAEATGFDAEAQAEDDDWILVEHFKLLLHPTELRSQHHIRCPPSKT